jgi:hypothetical protein
MWCLLVKSPAEVQVIGPFTTHVEAVIFVRDKFTKPVDSSAVILRMVSPDTHTPDGPR